MVGSPLVVEVDAQEVSLPMCRLSGQGLAGAVAGERAVILIEARDAREPAFLGGAAMGIAARVGGETSRGKLVDCGGGTYEASYFVEETEPVRGEFVSGHRGDDVPRALRAGQVDYQSCRVEGALHSRWVAGKQLALTCSRADRFGSRRESTSPPLRHALRHAFWLKVRSSRFAWGTARAVRRAHVVPSPACTTSPSAWTTSRWARTPRRSPISAAKNDLTGFADADAFGETARGSPVRARGRAKRRRAAGRRLTHAVGGVMGAAVARANLGGLFGRTMFPAPQRRL